MIAGGRDNRGSEGALSLVSASDPRPDRWDAPQTSTHVSDVDEDFG